MEEHVQDKIKKQRSEALHQLSDSKKKMFYLKNQGLDAKVLFESDSTGGFMHGFTENYIKVETKFDPALVNKICNVKLDNLEEKLCYGI